MMNEKLTERRVELATKKADRNKGRVRESGPGHPPNKFGLGKSRLLGRLVGREAVSKDDEIMGVLAHH